MSYGVLFLLVSVILVGYGAWLPQVAFLFWWCALSFSLVGLAYLGIGPMIFGKQANGRLMWWNQLLLLPYLMLMYGTWSIYRRLSKEAHADELLPGLWIGRRLQAKEYPQEIEVVLDLTCEFSAPGEVVSSKEYHCLPTLDATTPDREELLTILHNLSARSGVYIHCAQGHGRTGTVAAMWLLHHGLASNVEEAIQMIQERRPGVKVNKKQRQFLEHCTQYLEKKS